MKYVLLVGPFSHVKGVSIGPLIHPKYPDVDDKCKATDNFLGFMIMQVYHVSPLAFGEKYAGSKQTNEGPYIK